MPPILAFLLISLPFLSQAQLETYGRYTVRGSVEPNINYFGAKKITEKVSLTFFGLVEQKWSEALIGATWSPSGSFRMGASMGIEHGTNSPRFAIPGLSSTLWVMPAYDFEVHKAKGIIGIFVSNFL